MTQGSFAVPLVEAGKVQRAAPVIALTFTGAGADHLRQLLSGLDGLACTAGTGVLPLCHQAATAWQMVDSRAGAGLSSLAATSIRALSTTLLTAVLAREGGSRWCEFAIAPPLTAETFLRLYPQTRFLIVHRRAEAVIRAVLTADPWGLAGAEFAPFVSAHPASTVAALASYWAAHTSSLLEFERNHNGSCLRIRMEDVHSSPALALRDISQFLALDVAERSVLPGTALDEPTADSVPGDAGELPVDQIPPPLLARLNELHERLGYPALTGTGTADAHAL